MIHLKAEIMQHPQLLEKGVIIAPIALSRIAKNFGLKPAIIDRRRGDSHHVLSAGFVIITNPPESDAILRVSFVGTPVPLAWKAFKEDLKTKGVHYVHPENDEKRVILDITTKTLIVS